VIGALKAYKTLSFLHFLLDENYLVLYDKCMVKTGRPKLPAKERQSHLIAIRFTPDEYRELERAAQAAKLTVSEFVRRKVRGEK